MAASSNKLAEKVAAVQQQPAPAPAPTPAPAQQPSESAAATPPQAALSGAPITAFVPLPADLMQRYIALASAAGTDVQSFLAARLASAVEHHPGAGFWVTHSDRQLLSPFLNSDLTDAGKLLTFVRSLCELRLKMSPDSELGPITIYLDRTMLSRAVACADRDMTAERIIREGALFGIRDRLGM
jgi:hypothetical protein